MEEKALGVGGRVVRSDRKNLDSKCFGRVAGEKKQHVQGVEDGKEGLSEKFQAQHPSVLPPDRW
jgi:hypothetical protein